MIILIVDDERSIVELWKLHLQPLNCELRVAHNLSAALTEMRRLPSPDLVLLDLRLPPDTPEKVIEQVKTFREINSNAAVLVVSGLTEEQINDLIKHANVDGKITKMEAFVQRNLLCAIEQSLSRSKGIKDSCKIITTISALLQTIP